MCLPSLVRVERCLLSLLSVAVLLGAPSVAWTQVDPTGSIRGVVRDERGAVLPNASITATGGDVPFPYRTTSDSLGSYRLADLLPGTYRITAFAPGFATLVKQDVQVRAGLNLGFDMTLKVGEVGETVVVTSDAPLLEIGSPATALNFSGAFQRELSLAPRPQWFDFLRATPFSTLSENVYGATFWVSGADATSLVVQVDGADVAANSQSTTAYLRASAYIVEDVQVKTSGTEATTPLGHGGVISVVTRSGTDRLAGNVGFALQPKSWSAPNNPSGTSATYGVVQPDVAVGGPLVRGRAWFFGAYRYNKLVTGLDRPQGQFDTVRLLRPDLEPFDNRLVGSQTLAKLTWRASDSNRIDVSHMYGVDDVYSGSALDSEPFGYTSLGGQTIVGNLHSLWRGHTMIRGTITYNNQTGSNRAVSLAEPGRPVHLTTSRIGNTIVGNGAVVVLDNLSWGYSQESPAAKFTAVLDLSRTARFWKGEHELRIGTYLQPTREVVFEQHFAAGGLAVEELVFRDPSNLALGVIPFHQRLLETDRLTTLKVNSQNYAGYVQDAWRVNDRLTVTAGLRVDAIKRRDRLFDTTVQRTVAVGPRIGARYSFASGRRVLRGGWNRIHDAVSTGSDFTVGTNEPGVTDLYDLNLDGTFETSQFTPGVNSLMTNRYVDLDRFRQPVVDEGMVGFSQQLPGQLTVDASLVRRHYRDRGATIDVNGIYENGRFIGYRDESFNEVYKVTSNEYNTPIYTAFDVHFAKRTTRMQIVGGYTRQWRHIEGDWQPNDPAAIIQPDAFANDRGLGAFFRPTTSSLSGADSTLASQWRDHAVRVMASVRMPFAMNFAVAYWGQSGPWSGPIVKRLSASDPAFGPPTVRLSNGRVVNNPLATTIRFAFPTRGEGQTRLPSVHAWNMKVTRDITWRRVTFRPGIEVLNVLNRRTFYDYLRNANQLYNPNVGRGNNPQLPRATQLSLSMTF